MPRPAGFVLAAIGTVAADTRDACPAPGKEQSGWARGRGGGWPRPAGSSTATKGWTAWCVVATADVGAGQASGVLPGFSLHGAASHSGPFCLDAADTRRVPGCTLRGFGAAHGATIGARPVVFRLLAENVTDERHRTGGRGGPLGVGTPRNSLFPTSLRL